MKVLNKIISTVSIISIAWFVISWIEIVCKNLSEPHYSPLNLIVLLLELAQ